MTNLNLFTYVFKHAEQNSIKKIVGKFSNFKLRPYIFKIFNIENGSDAITR